MVVKQNLHDQKQHTYTVITQKGSNSKGGPVSSCLACGCPSWKYLINYYEKQDE